MFLSAMSMDSDFVDRLNYGFTGLALLFLAGLVSIWQSFSKTIECWTPQEFTRSWENYGSSNCWTSNTYYPTKRSEEEPVIGTSPIPMTGYYRWAAVVLAMQTLMFCLPCIIWRMLMSWSGFDVRRIMRSVQTADSGHHQPEAQNNAVQSIASDISSCIERQSRSWRSYLVVLYFIIKILYLVNSVTQLVIIALFTGCKNWLHGFAALFDILFRDSWPESANLPRTIQCYWNISKLGKTQKYTFPCILTMNSLLELIFLVLWFWCLLISLVTLVSLVFWVVRLVNPQLRTAFVHSYINTPMPQQSTSDMFVEQYLGMDGVFIVRLIAANCGDILARKLVCEMHDAYKSRRLVGDKLLVIHEGPRQASAESC